MTDLLDRLRREDPSALEEVGHELLPFVQAAILAHAFVGREPGAVLQAFREAVAAAKQSADQSAFFAAVLQQVRARGPSLPQLAPDPAQAEALARLSRLAPMSLRDREVVLARFIERLPPHLIVQQFALELPALAAILASGAALLVGPAPAGAGWASEPSLTDPDAPPVAQFVALENLLTPLAIDVTALERQPLVSAVGVPVLKPGYQAQAPAESYPSKVETQGSVDLPAEVSSFTPSASSAPSVVVSSSLAQPRPRDDATEPQARPLIVPAKHDETEVRGKPLIATAPKVRGTPLPLLQGEHTEPRGAPIVEHTDIGVALAVPPRALPLHRRIPGVWWWSAAGLCALLGSSLYWGMVTNLKATIRRPWTMVPVIVATQDLTEGSLITLEMVAIRAIPEQYATQSVVKPESLEFALGQVLEFPLQAGDPLLWAQFDPVRRSKRFDVVKRARAYTIPVTELKSLGGLLLPKEEVDLLLTLHHTPGQVGNRELGMGGTDKTITLLQKVRILAVGGVTTLNIGRVQRRFTDITLLLVPEEVEVLSLALRTGELTATLRNPEDPDTIVRGETTLQTLLNGIRLKALEARRADVIKVIRSK